MANSNSVGPSPLYRTSSHESPHGKPKRSPRREASEETPLLKAVNEVPYRGDSRYGANETLGDNELSTDDEDESAYDNELQRTTSQGQVGLGIEPASIESAMYRSSSRDKYSGSRRGSIPRSRRPSNVSRGRDEEEGGRISEGDEEEESKGCYNNGMSSRQFWVIFGGILMNVFISCFDSTIMASSHPVITSYFHASNSASWMSTSFLLTSTSFQPLYGRLSDTMGRKPPYIFGMTFFLVGTLWCALAQSMTSFILARALCGFGAGGMLTMGSIITSDMVPIEIRGIYQSYINIFFGAGAALGAATGGAMADNLGWRWEFGVQIPVLAVFLGLAIYTVPYDLGLNNGEENESFMTAMKTFDYRGSIVLTSGITFLILALSLGGNILQWRHPLVVFSLSYFLLSVPVLIWLEHRHPRPILPPYLLTSFPRGNMIISNFFSAIVINAVLFNVPIYYQAVLLESATSSGLRLLVPTISATAAGISTGFLITWSRRLKWPMFFGGFLVFLGPTLLSTMDRSWPTWISLMFLVPSSMGQGFQFPGTFIGILAVGEQAEQAVVTSTLILWRSLGMVLGVSVSSLVLQNSLFGFLQRFVEGADKEKTVEGQANTIQIIQEVRENIESIANLAAPYREQVVEAYAESLRVTFIAMSIVGLIGFVIILPVKMPRLSQKPTRR